MDTIKKLYDYSMVTGRGHTNFLGVPKTIDNDLALTDHTPDMEVQQNISEHR